MSENPFQYQTILKAPVGEFKDRGSKFYGYCYEINSVDDVKAHIEQLKQEHPKARHWCYAYRIGLDQTNFRANDDGEPSGSAGKPILGQIDSFELTNTLIVVVRYFGGTKLGVGGLIQAYRGAAMDALSRAEFVTKEVFQLVSIQFDYAAMNDVMSLLKQYDITIRQQQFEIDCNLQFELPQSLQDVLIQQLSEYAQIEQVEG